MRGEFRDHTLQVWFDPWGDLLPLEPGGSLRLVGTSTEPGAFQVVEEEDRVVVYAWPGSTVQAFQGETVVNDMNVPVPGTPPGSRTNPRGLLRAEAY